MRSSSASLRIPSFADPVCLFIIVAVMLGLPALVPHARAQGITTIASVSSSGAPGDDVSKFPAISGDGRFVAFLSYASTLVIGDNNDALDVFVRDRTMSLTTRVSVSTEGVEGDLRSGGYCVIGGRGEYSGLAISGDGRFVAFGSAATNLVADDTAGMDDVFVHDRQTGVTERVSVGPLGVEGNNDSSCPALSADGRYVAFTSQASNLVPDDTNGFDDIFVHDRQTGTTTRVNVGPGGVQADGGSYIRRPAISGDGRFVAFESEATNLVTVDTNGMADIFVRDRVGGTTARVSVSTGNGESNGHSSDPALSGDGRYVAFSSEASTLVTGDTNGVKDIFVHDAQTGVTARVSVGLAGAQANNFSIIPALNADGRFVTFESQASNLVLGDQSPSLGLFLFDRLTGATTRVSVGAMTAGGLGPAPLSADGGFVAFYGMGNLVESISSSGVFVRDRHAVVRPLAPAGDYDGDGRADVTVYRPWRGVWYIVRSTGGPTSVTWGLPLDLPVPADYDGDGKTDVAVYRPENGTWYIVRSTTGTCMSLRWGTLWDLPVPADYDGDGKADPAVFRKSTGEWYQMRSTTGTGYRVIWGTVGDLPVPADYDGDGRADPTVFRPSAGRWYQLRSATGTGVGITWGVAGDTPLAGDYDGDGKADPTVFRPSTGTWFQLRSATNTGVGIRWGVATDVPLVGSYDADAKADPTVYRPSTGTWYQLRSLTGTGYGVMWGIAGDLPR